MSDYQVRVAVLVVAIKDGKVLLARRANTKYMDGYYGLPGGHVEKQEKLEQAAARELFEETGLSAGQLKLFHVYQNNSTPERQYIGFVFLANQLTGEMKIEEDKADDIGMFSLEKLPEKIIPYHQDAIMHANDAASISISYISV